ncbi:MAG TPA: orotate phosphoribosyltransferase, partial [Bacteroidetes bacterium]|nr:orotate phosphoribosyltransferase [Bacteroidota bacterium]
TERSKETDEMILRRGFDIEEGENGLIVEDVLTTGRSVRELVNLLRKENARLVGTGFIVDRSSNRVKFGTPKYAILEMPVVTYPPEDCPLCKKGIPISKPGSRKKIAQ